MMLAETDTIGSRRERQNLGISIHGDEADATYFGRDHAVDCVHAPTTDADNDNINMMLCLIEFIIF